MQDIANETLLELTAKIVSAYVARNPVPALEVPTLLEAVFRGLGQISNGRIEQAKPVEALKSAVRIKKSVTDEYLICLEDGKRFKSLKRHLMSDYGMTPENYRAKWGLAHDYPMVAPAYAKSRSTLAKMMGFGRKPGTILARVTVPAPPEPTIAIPEPAVIAAVARKRRKNDAAQAA